MNQIKTAFTAEQYANPYPPGIEKHYWHQGRNRIVLRKLGLVLRADTKILDVGCGPGILVDHLRHAGVECFGVDPGSPDPATPAVAPFLTLGVSAFDLPPAMRAGYSILLLMDVLEHLEEPLPFLRDCARAFPAARHIFVTLPARMEIWSSYDEYYGHYRRYTLESLRELVGQTEFKLRDAGYFFHALYAAARVKVAGSRTRSHLVAAPRLALPHLALGRLLDLEERLTPGALPGSSLFGLLERSPS